MAGNTSYVLLYMSNETGGHIELNPLGDPTLFNNIYLISGIITFIFGLCGNTLVLLTISYHRRVRQKSVANYYIWNLALADLLFILTIPFLLLSTYTDDWPFGIVICKIVWVLHETNRFSSIFTLVALSFDRFLASFYNLGHWRTLRVGSFTCIVIWLLCGMISSPYWLYAVTEDKHYGEMVNNKTRVRPETICHFPWPSNDAHMLDLFWNYFQVCVGLIVPFIIILTSYLMLAFRLQRLTRSGQQTQVKRPSRKTTRTVIIVVLIFLICQTPYYAFSVWKIHGAHFMLTSTEKQKWMVLYINAMCLTLVFVSSCCNPILYGILNDNYRSLYRVVLCRLDCKKSRVPQDVDVASSDSNAGSSMASSAVTYRFQISFHKPCIRNGYCNKKRKRSVPTENMIMLDDRLVPEAKNVATSDERPKTVENNDRSQEETQPLKDENGKAGGVHLG